MMKVIAPNQLLRDAAGALVAVRDDVVVFGASAITVALHGRPAAITPTRDVDVRTTADDAARVIKTLEAAGMTRSELEHEEPFTWVRGDLKVQLVRPFHPFPKGPARRLPINNTLSELDRHRVAVAFDDEPTTQRLWCANASALVVLKAQAFGRTRHDGNPVDRDYADVVQLLEHTIDEIVAETVDDLSMRGRVVDAARRVVSDDEALGAATRELVRSGAYPSPRAARDASRRAIARALRSLDATAA